LSRFTPPLLITAAIPRVNKAQAMCGYVDGYLRQNGYRFALRDGPRIEEPLDNPPADGQSHLPPPPPSPGGAGLSLLHRELFPVNCTESYSRSATPRATRSATPRATPGQLHRELLPVCYTESYPVCYTESYSRSATPRATPGLLHRELLPVNCTESYSRSATLQQVTICREGRQGQVLTIVFRE
jgi:hypothetical protein